MKTIRYRVTLQEPAILTAIEGEPNSSVSYDYIPGSVMRGYFISQMMKQYNPDDFDPADEGIARLFFSNWTRYLNLYPVIRDQRALPVPVSWRRKKYSIGNDNNPIYDEALHSEDRDTVDKLTSVSGFVARAPGSDSVEIYKPKRIVNVHTQRARRSPDEQQVYRYDALAPGQTFEGLILCAMDEDASTLFDLMRFQESIYVGGARSAGYGLAQLEVNEQNISDQWQEVEHSPNTTMVVTLLSDVILRDEHGQYAATFDAMIRALQDCGITFDCEYIALQTTLVGGFNRKWGLPLPQTPALKKGSVLSLVNVQWDDEAQVQLLWNGLGERTNEGFGQIALNWQVAATISSVTYKQIRSLPSAQPSVDGAEMWDFFQNRITASAVTPEIVQRLFTENRYRIIGDISPSQLARLRAKIADELRKNQPSLNAITEHLDDISGEKDAKRTGGKAKAKAAGKQFARARINGRSLLEWLSNPTFDFDTSASNRPEYQLQLVDTVLERAQKERSSRQPAGA